MQLLVNARFRGRVVTGVERFSTRVVDNLKVPFEEVGRDWPQGPRGHLREQIFRRGSGGSALLWSPANTGPILHKNHVVTIHDAATLRHPEHFSNSFRKVYSQLIPALAARARLVVVPSEFTANELSHFTGIHANRVRVIPNGIDPPNPHFLWEPDQLEPFFLIIGTLEPRKNLQRLLKAYRAERDDNDSFPRLLIVGGSGRNFASADKMTAEGVTFAGRITDEKLDELYGACLAVINVSLYEGFGLPVLEAASRGVPLMASDIPPHREILRDHPATLVDPLSVDSIREGLRLVSAGLTAKPKRLNWPSWREVASTYVTTFNELT